MSTKREHDPITAAELRKLAEMSHVAAYEFAEISGADPRRVRRWLSGEQDNPPLWVPMLWLALTVPEARIVLRQWIAENTVPVDEAREDRHAAR